MTKKDGYFIALTIITSITLFAFVFWIGFPGYFQEGDIYNSLSVTTDHWHPIIIARFVQSLYFLFGKHSFYLFFLNIFCFYAGFSFFIIALYLRTKNFFWYALFFITVIGNIFFQNFIQYHSFTFPMLLWLGCSMVFFQISVHIRNRYISLALRLLTFIIFFLSLMWRHNAIITIYPMFILFIYVYMKSISSTSLTIYTVRFISMMIASALFLVVIVKLHPYVLSDNISKITANHIFLHQIAGMVVPNNDSSFIPQEWYEKNKDFQDVKEMYEKYPTIADPFNVGWEPYNSNRPFKRGTLNNLKILWFKGIIAYPHNYIRHISRFYKEMWFQEPGWIFNSGQIQAAPVHPWHVNIASNFKKNERHIKFSTLKEGIYNFLFKEKILLNHIVGIIIGFVVLFLSCCLWLLPSFRADVLLFALSTSLSACCTAITVCIFSPYADPRYMSPVLVLSLISLIGLCAHFVQLGSSKNNNEQYFQDHLVKKRYLRIQ